MRSAYDRIRWVSITFCVMLLLGATANAADHTRNRSRGKSNAARIAYIRTQSAGNIALANQLLAKAEQAEVVAEHYRDVAYTFAIYISNANASIKNQREYMQQIETQILDKQPENSEFVQLMDNYEAAWNEYKEIRDKLTNSKEYQIQYSRALEIRNAKEKDKKLSDLKYDFFTKNKAYASALANYEFNKSRFETVRMELLKADNDWMKAAEEVREAHLAAADAKDRLTGAGFKKMHANQNLRAANETVHIAKNVLAKNQANLKSLPKGKASKPATSLASKSNK